MTELSRVGLLSSLPGETLTRLAERMSREDVPAGRTIVAECPFVRRFVEEHPDYQDLLA